MRSTGTRRAVIVGIFIFLGVGILIVTILTLGSQKKTFGDSVGVISFFENVNGLQKGNNIWFSGVKVGTIKNITIRGNGRVEVDMNVEDKSAAFIKKDALAKLSTDGLIGNKIIEIYGGSPESPAISQGDTLGGAKLLSTDEMMNTLSKNNDNILAITNDLKVITSGIAQGKGSIGKLLTSDELADNLNHTVLTVQKASENLERLSANISNYTASLNNKGSFANDLVTDTVIFSKLRGTMSRLQNVADSATQVIGNLNATTNTLNNGLNNKNTPVGMLLNDEKTADGMKATLQNLESASKKLDEDLEALQHNFLFKKYFKKKAKEDQKVVLDTLVN
jgi:phospholipid/cholesterol/gamma-HCH transport system substrate-binding protein